jgi:hypothetical protein
MSTRNLLVGKGRPARKDNNLTAICEQTENVGASTSHNPMGLHGLLHGLLYILLLLLLLPSNTEQVGSYVSDLYSGGGRFENRAGYKLV